MYMYIQQQYFNRKSAVFFCMLHVLCNYAWRVGRHSERLTDVVSEAKFLYLATHRQSNTAEYSGTTITHSLTLV